MEEDKRDGIFVGADDGLGMAVAARVTAVVVGEDLEGGSGVSLVGADEEGVILL